MNVQNFTQRFNLFFIISGLGFLSGLPAAMFSSTLQAWFTKADASLLFITSLSLLNLPFLLRFIWGPMVDKYYLSSFGRRRTWLLLTQFLLFVAIEFMALGNPKTSPYYLVGLSFILAFFSSIQDLVIDAHRIEFLPESWYGFGAVVAIYAYRIALLVSGGLSLILAEHFGFSLTYSLLGCFYLLGMILVYFSPEPKLPSSRLEQGSGPYRDFFNQPNLIWIMGILLCTKFGEVFVSNTSPMIIPFMMRGLGLSLSYIAYVNKIFGLITQLVGSALAAFFIWRFSLINLLLAFGILESISNFLFVVLSHNQLPPWGLWGIIGFENLATGLCSTVMVAFLMKSVNPQYTATQFSLWIMIAIIPKFVVGPFGGFISQHYGWTSLFEISTILTSLFVIFWWKLYKANNFTKAGLNQVNFGG